MALQFMPLYIGDYLADTGHLSAEQHGIYLLLLMAMWRSGGKLPDDSDQLAVIAKSTGGKWSKNWQVIRPLLRKNRRGFLVQKRLSLELEKAQHLHDVRSEAGSKGGSKTQARLKQGSSTAKARARVPQPQPHKKTLQGRSLRPGASARQRAAGALAPAPAGEAREQSDPACAKPPPARVGSMRAVGRALPPDFRVAEPASSQANPSAGSPGAPLTIGYDHDREKRRQRCYEFAAARLPDSQKSAAFLGLGGGDPEHTDQWWLDTLDERIRAEQWSERS